MEYYAAIHYQQDLVENYSYVVRFAPGTVLRTSWFLKKLLFRPDKHAANYRGQCEVQCSDQLQKGARLSQPKKIALYFEHNLSSL
jgi:hypothetical protein